MKKITLFIFLLSFTFSFSQVLSEDFEAGLSLPAGWTNNDLALPTNGEVWTFETGGEAALAGAGNTLVYTAGECIGNYATFDSDAYGDNGTAENAALESPVFDCSALTQVTLSYNHLFAGNYGGTGFVEVLDGDAAIPTWTTVETYSGDGYQGGLISLDVTAELAGVTNAQIRFRFTGDWSVAWYVDNVSVFECTVTAPDAVVSATTPADGAINVPITIGSSTNSVGPFEWVAAATGDPADSYNFSLGLTNTGDDIGTINGFNSGNDIFYGFQPNTLYYWRIDAVNCAGTTNGPVWSFTTEACTASAPTAVVSPDPGNGAIDVPLDNSDTNYPNRVYFSWSDGLGDPGEAFTLNLGTQNPPTDNSFGDFTNGDFIFGLAESTTYYWSVEAINCAGSSTPTVWSFTTGIVLSVDEDELSLFKAYPNPVRDILNIETSLQIDQIEIYNLIGQKVKTFSGNNIYDNSINLSQLDKGLYMAIISAEDKIQTIKITKE